MDAPGLKRALKRRLAGPSLDNSTGSDDGAGDMTFPEPGDEPFNLSPNEISTAWRQR